MGTLRQPHSLNLGYAFDFGLMEMLERDFFFSNALSDTFTLFHSLTKMYLEATAVTSDHWE